MSKAKGYSSEVGNALTSEFLAGGAKPDLTNYQIELPEEEEPLHEFRIDVDLLRTLAERACDLEIDEKRQWDMDPWLAPRLHAGLRIPKRLASDPRLWSWLAINVFNDYVHKRFSDAEGVSAWRYTGPLTRNAVSRLWWGAEMIRNGPDYSYVPRVFSRVRTAQWALELKYSWYRPAPLAFVEVAEPEDGPQMSDNDMKALSKRINANLTLTALEAIGFDPDASDAQYDLEWRLQVPTAEVLLSDELPEGPDDGYASVDAVQSLAKWFKKLAAGAEPAVEAA